MRLAPLLLALAVSASAQVVPDEFPDPTEPLVDRSNRELAERHRPFLSGLFASSTLAVGPEVGVPALVGAAAFEGGYRFGSGHAVALASDVRSPLAQSPVTGAPEASVTASVGLEAIVALGRGADRASILRGAEIGLGVGASVFSAENAVTGFTEDHVVPSLSLSPRVALPLSPTMAVPVGLRVSTELGRGARPGPFVGLSVGVRRIWADEARMVLE